MPRRNQAPDEDVMEAITFVRMCREFRTLPREGGLLDQDAYHVWLMEKVTMADRERQELDSQKAKADAQRPGNKR